MRDLKARADYQRAWHLKNKEHDNALNRQRYAANRESKRKIARDYYHKNKGKMHRDGHIAYLKRKERDPSYQSRQGKRERDKLRLSVLEAYGKICVCCGESAEEFLTIDHINGRKSVGHPPDWGGDKLYRYLRRNNYPKDEYRLLCMNCNFSYGRRGYCPHNHPVTIA